MGIHFISAKVYNSYKTSHDDDDGGHCANEDVVEDVDKRDNLISPFFVRVIILKKIMEANHSPF